MSTTIYLIRHGEAAGAWDDTLDPGLSAKGFRQAAAMAEKLGSLMSPVDIYTSPLKRTQETAAPLASLWKRKAVITPALTEVPSDGVDFSSRRQWLNGVLAGSWPDQADNLKAWREAILDFTTSRGADAVFVTHFVVINTIIGAIRESRQLVSCRPDHCSITKIRLEDGQLSLLALGAEAETVIR